MTKFAEALEGLSGLGIGTSCSRDRNWKEKIYTDKKKLKKAPEGGGRGHCSFRPKHCVTNCVTTPRVGEAWDGGIYSL